MTTADIDSDQGFDPSDVNAWVRRAGYFAASRRYAEASAASDQALAIKPTHQIATRIGIRSRIAACDWQRRNDDERRIFEGVRAGLPIITPFNFQTICNSEADNLVVAKQWAKAFPASNAPLWRGERYQHDRIRVAYLSAEFQEHATAILMAGLFENHDRTRFEIFAISYGPNDQSPMRRRLESAFDRFIDVRAMSDLRVAKLLREREIDIAVHLNGSRGAARTGILAHRPAPAQLSYLGYPGTMAVPFIDYILADQTVIPADELANYTEKVVYLPNSYQCNDSRRHIPKRTTTRTEAGLPADGFVFCCFNNNYKINPTIFDVWMRLLSALPGSVLWLLGDQSYAMNNLRREALVRGVSPDRLVFAPRIPPDDHLDRLTLADLFLDTLPVNAHATASDALWAGLPVLTCMGTSFSGRVAASLLRAVGMPELITTSLDDYEQLALALAQNPERLTEIKAKLARNRSTEPLFDTKRFTRELEAAYTTIWQRQQAGRQPASFSVEV